MSLAAPDVCEALVESCASLEEAESKLLARLSDSGNPLSGHSGRISRGSPEKHKENNYHPSGNYVNTASKNNREAREVGEA